MRLAVFADVHDNLPALEAVVEDIRQQRVDGIITAGDTVLRGPFPVETTRLLRSLGAWMIRGNAEAYLLAYDAGEAPPSWYTSDQWAAIRWTYDQLDRETLDFLATLPEHRVIAFWTVEHRAVAYDVSPLRRAFRERGLLAEGGAFARAYLLTIETGRNAVGHLFSYIDTLAVEAGLEDWSVVPEAIWDHAVSTFCWTEYAGESRRGQFA